MLLIIIRTLIALWPFIKENVLGNREIEYLNVRNRPMTLMLVSVLVMFGLFIYITDHAFLSTTDLQRARNEVRVLTVKLEENTAYQIERDLARESLLVRVLELEDTVAHYRERLDELRIQNKTLLELVAITVPDVKPKVESFTKQTHSKAAERYGLIE